MDKKGFKRYHRAEYSMLDIMLDGDKITKGMHKNLRGRLPLLLNVVRKFDPQDMSHYAQAIVTEHMWDKKGRHTIFLGDDNVIKAIELLRVEKFDMFTLPQGSWMIVPPKTSNLRPVIFETFIPRERNEMFWDMLYPGKGSECPEDNSKPVLSWSMVYVHDDYVMEHSGTMDTLQDIQKNIDTEGADEQTEFALNEFARHLEFAVRTILYSMVFPQRLESGAPKLVAIADGKTDNQIIREAPTVHAWDTPGAVGLHYRQLRDERYYQGEYAKLRRGTRFVEVQPHVRGTKNPYSLG